MSRSNRRRNHADRGLWRSRHTRCRQLHSRDSDAQGSHCHATVQGQEPSGHVGKTEVQLSTAAITVSVDTATGAVSFLSSDGKVVLAEPKQGGKAFDVPSVFETKTWQVQQTFLSPPDEALYGLGQHQEGIFNVRGVPIRLHQANTNISIPFLLSSKGYGILWNNASLTDFNPADQSIAIDPTTGKGKFTTGAKGLYGFLLSSDNRKQAHAGSERAASDRFEERVDPNFRFGLSSIWKRTRSMKSPRTAAREEFTWQYGLLRTRPHSAPKWGRPSTTTSSTALS